MVPRRVGSSGQQHRVTDDEVDRHRQVEPGGLLVVERGDMHAKTDLVARTPSAKHRGISGEAENVLGDAFDNPRFLSPAAPKSAWVGVRVDL